MSQSLELLKSLGLEPVSNVVDPVTRASLFTLVVIANEADRQILDLVTKKYPCKVIFVLIDTHTTEKTRLEKFFTKSRDTNYFDFTVITSSPDSLETVPFFILPELSSDLPSYLLTLINPNDIASLLNILEKYVETIAIANSSLSTETICSYQRTMTHPHKLVDIQWVRTKPWREAMLRVFSTKTSVDTLITARLVTITYAEGIDTQASLFRSWLASRLDKSSSDIAIVARASQFGAEPGSIFRIDISLNDEETYIFSYEKDDAHIQVHHTTKDRCELPYTLFVGTFRKGRNLVNEIFFYPSKR